jgi:hypothetical protein
MRWQSFVIPIVCFSAVLFAAFATEDFGVRVGICGTIIAISIPAQICVWWLFRSHEMPPATSDNPGKPKKPWNFSLLSLLVVATIAPAVLAGIYFGICLVWNLGNLAPTLDTSYGDCDNPNARSFKSTGPSEADHGHMTIFVNTHRTIQFDKAITKFTPAEQPHVRVKRWSGNLFQITGLRTGEAQLLVWDSYGDQFTFDISVIDR